MNNPTRQEIESLLWTIANDKTPLPEPVEQALTELLSWVRAWLRVASVTCPTCDGRGTHTVQAEAVNIGSGIWEAVTYDCSDCAGSGVVPNPLIT